MGKVSRKAKAIARPVVSEGSDSYDGPANEELKTIRYYEALLGNSEGDIISEIGREQGDDFLDIFQSAGDTLKQIKAKKKANQFSKTDKKKDKLKKEVLIVAPIVSRNEVIPVGPLRHTIESLVLAAEMELSRMEKGPEHWGGRFQRILNSVGEGNINKFIPESVNIREELGKQLRKADGLAMYPRSGTLSPSALWAGMAFVQRAFTNCVLDTNSTPSLISTVITLIVGYCAAQYKSAELASGKVAWFPLVAFAHNCQKLIHETLDGTDLDDIQRTKCRNAVRALALLFDFRLGSVKFLTTLVSAISGKSIDETRGDLLAILLQWSMRRVAEDEIGGSSSILQLRDSFAPYLPSEGDLGEVSGRFKAFVLRSLTDISEQLTLAAGEKEKSHATGSEEHVPTLMERFDFTRMEVARLTSGFRFQGIVLNEGWAPTKQLTSLVNTFVGGDGGAQAPSADVVTDGKSRTKPSVRSKNDSKARELGLSSELQIDTFHAIHRGASADETFANIGCLVNGSVKRVVSLQWKEVVVVILTVIKRLPIFYPLHIKLLDKIRHLKTSGSKALKETIIGEIRNSIGRPDLPVAIERSAKLIATLLMNDIISIKVLDFIPRGESLQAEVMDARVGWVAAFTDRVDELADKSGKQELGEELKTAARRKHKTK